MLRDVRDIEVLRSCKTFMVRDMGILLGDAGLVLETKWLGGVFSSGGDSIRGITVNVELVLRLGLGSLGDASREAFRSSFADRLQRGACIPVFATTSDSATVGLLDSASLR